MADPNYTDVQQITCVIPTLGTAQGTQITVTHNLQDEAGAHYTPDTVFVNVVSALPAPDSAPCLLAPHVRIPSTPEDGTYDLQLRAANENASVADWTVTLQITSMYHHSIQSDDHTPEVTVQAGTPIIDCGGQA